MKILVAMSGGVDSSVVAHLLTRQGHEVVGVRFLLWSDPLAPALAQLLPSKCCNTQTMARARDTAQALGIPLHILDLEQEFKRDVVDPFLEDYKNGLTPNPCIGCNRTIKFGRLLALADELRCDALATGHYARIERRQSAQGKTTAHLVQATDASKDQSYYLYGLDQTALRRILFPLGDMRKTDVFALAKEYGVPLPDIYRESQDLCFFPEKSPKEFLKRHLKDDIKPGAIVRRNGQQVGMHKGLPLYTVGQRRGLGIGGLTIPLEVVAKDSMTNTLIVDEKGREMTRTVRIRDMLFPVSRPAEGKEYPLDCQTRSLSQHRTGRFTLHGDEGTFVFDEPQPLATPGQSLVLYSGNEVIGGGIICA